MTMHWTLPDIDPDHAKELLHEMVRIRRFEERCAELYTTMQIRGFLHLYVGQEAVAVGAMQALEPEDAIVAAYREHGHALVRGVPSTAVMPLVSGSSGLRFRDRRGVTVSPIRAVPPSQPCCPGAPRNVDTPRRRALGLRLGRVDHSEPRLASIRSAISVVRPLPEGAAGVCSPAAFRTKADARREAPVLTRWHNHRHGETCAITATSRGVTSGVMDMTTERIHRAVSPDGTEIVGRLHGAGPPLVLVHGALADGDNCWGSLLPFLAERFTCYTPSLRGRGLSGDHPDLSPERLVEDVTAFVDSIGEPVALLGYSAGGVLALGVAARTTTVAAVAAYEPPAPEALGDHEAALLAQAGARIGPLVARCSNSVTALSVAPAGVRWRG